MVGPWRYVTAPHAGIWAGSQITSFKSSYGCLRVPASDEGPEATVRDRREKRTERYDLEAGGEVGETTGQEVCLVCKTSRCGVFTLLLDLPAM
jgi:hypothetical protein